MSEENTPKYLLFDTEDEGLERADIEGQKRGYAYHRVGHGTRYHSAPIPCVDGKWALYVTDYMTLTEDETTVSEVSLLTEEE